MYNENQEHALRVFASSLYLEFPEDQEAKECLSELKQCHAKRGEITYWFYNNRNSPEGFPVLFSMDLLKKYMNNPKHYIIHEGVDGGILSVKDKYIRESNVLSSSVRFRVVLSEDGKDKAVLILGPELVILGEADQYKFMDCMINGDNFKVGHILKEMALGCQY